MSTTSTTSTASTASQTIELRGERLAYRRAGTGPAMLLVHSLGASSAMWESTLEALSATHAVVAMDCRGHGHSSNKGGFTLDDVAGDGLALMTALGFERFGYVGISMGGLIGVRLNAFAAQRVSAMVLADSYATIGAMGPARLEATKRAFAAQSMEAFAAAYAQQTLRADTPKATHDMLAALIASMRPDDYLQTLDAILLGDVSHELRWVQCPTLVLVGDEDQRTPVDMSKTLVRGIGGSELGIVSNAGHLAVLDNPGQFNALVVEFLRESQLRNGDAAA